MTTRVIVRRGLTRGTRDRHPRGRCAATMIGATKSAAAACDWLRTRSWETRVMSEQSKMDPCSLSTGGNGVIPTGESVQYPRRVQEDDIVDGSPTLEDGRSPDLLWIVRVPT